MLAHRHRAKLARAPERVRPAQPHNRFRNLRRHRPAVTSRRARALLKTARARLEIPAEPLVARLPADPVRRAKLRHRRLATMPRQNKIQLLVHATGFSPGHRPPPGRSITCHPSIRSNLLPIYPVCTGSNPPLRRLPFSDAPECASNAFPVSPRTERSDDPGSRVVAKALCGRPWSPALPSVGRGDTSESPGRFQPRGSAVISTGSTAIARESCPTSAPSPPGSAV